MRLHAKILCEIWLLDRCKRRNTIPKTPENKPQTQKNNPKQKLSTYIERDAPDFRGRRRRLSLFSPPQKEWRKLNLPRKPTWGSTTIQRKSRGLEDGCWHPPNPPGAFIELRKRLSHLLYKLKRVIYEAKRPQNWRRASKDWKKQHPNCAICNSTKKIEAHDVYPYHLVENPTEKSYEFWFENLISLCFSDHRGLAHCNDPGCLTFNEDIRGLASMISSHCKEHCRRGR